MQRHPLAASIETLTTTAARSARVNRGGDGTSTPPKAAPFGRLARRGGHEASKDKSSDAQRDAFPQNRQRAARLDTAVQL